VDRTPEVPHGIRYNLTLHDRHNQRIYGMDNAHAVPRPDGLYQGRLIQYDHIHPDLGKTITPYEFTDSHQLLKDFLDEVDRRVELDKR